ncbi:hypothetical protein GCM10023068_43430 [Leifsonia shinshuensis]
MEQVRTGATVDEMRERVEVFSTVVGAGDKKIGEVDLPPARHSVTVENLEILL